NCTTQRLRLLHALLTSPFNVQCAHCGLQLCKREDFLVMSKRGTGGTFVNPSGSVSSLFDDDCIGFCYYFTIAGPRAVYIFPNNERSVSQRVERPVNNCYFK